MGKRQRLLGGCILGICLVALLVIFNPGLEQHQTKLLRCLDAVDKRPIQIPIASSACVDPVIDPSGTSHGWLIDRVNDGLFSLGYMKGRWATFGILGFVHVRTWCVKEDRKILFTNRTCIPVQSK